MAGFLVVLIPLIAVVVGILIHNIVFLDYVHVLLGAIWIGVDAFLGVIFRFVYVDIPEDTLSDVSERILPATMYYLPATSFLTPLAGYFLAIYEGIWNPYSDIFMLIIVVASLVVATGLLTVFYQSLKIYLEKSKGINSVVSPKRRFDVICNGALIQLVLQVILVGFMAELVVFG
ncbi:MAG: hypothetical protein M1605_02620 [Candidatus Thermoplasmatota archaeon]|nr:hypothetical protein [Candidatus Thermoplasmatota archaeon]